MAGLNDSAGDMMSAYYNLLANTPNDGEGVLTKEIAAQHGITEERARNIIRALKSAGKVVDVHTRKIQRIDGSWQRVVSYKLVDND